jgi:hypothetical protein
MKPIQSCIAIGQVAGVRFLAGVRYFCFPHSFQTGPVANPASYVMGTGSYFPGGKVTGA